MQDVSSLDHRGRPPGSSSAAAAAAAASGLSGGRGPRGKLKRQRQR